MKIIRDYSVKNSSNARRAFLINPNRKIALWLLEYMNIILFKFFRPVYYILNQYLISRRRAHARKINKKLSNTFTIQSENYFEIQIKNETRPSLILKEGEKVEFSLNKTGNEYLSFGIAPLINDHSISNISDWKVELIIIFDDDEKIKKVISLPYNNFDEVSAYYHHDGWVDLFYDLSNFKKNIISVKLKVVINKKRKSFSKENISISTPQITNKKKHTKNIIVISCETLSDFNFLQNRYGFKIPEPINELIEDGVNYPLAYSPADSTLPFGASFFSGLMVSQHGVGDYSKNADGFSNQILNRTINTLPEILKCEGFNTLFGATGGRFSSEAGFAKGFNSHYHAFMPFDPSLQPDFNWVFRNIASNKHRDNFIFLHTDFFHDPKMVFNDNTKGDNYNFDNIAGDKNTVYLYERGLEKLSIELSSFLRNLKKINSYDSSMIILTGDHGAGINWVKNSKYSLYEERIRVPLLIKYPDWCSEKEENKAIINTNTEIQKAIYRSLGMQLPDHLKLLTEYKKQNKLIYSETIFNPKKDPFAHALALMNEKFKYVNFNRINLESFRYEKTNDAFLFKWDKSIEAFNEKKNLINEKIYFSIAKDLQTISKNIITNNLSELKKHPSELY